MTIPTSEHSTRAAKRSLAGVVAAVLVAASSAASAQDTGIKITLVPDYGQADTESVVINFFECQDAVDDDLTFTVTFEEARFNDGSTNSEFSFKLETTANACIEDLTSSGEGCELLTEPEIIDSDFIETHEMSFAAVTGITDAAGCRTTDKTINFVVNSVYGVTDGTDTGKVSDDFSMIFKLTAPDAPTNLSAVAGESSIKLDFDAPAATDEDTTYNAYIATTNEFSQGEYTDDYEVRGIRRVKGGSSTALTINEGIDVGVEYFLVVVAEDSNGNESAVSNVANVVTVPTNDFYETYRNAGGGDSGGFFCAAVPPVGRSPLPGLVVVALLALGGLLLSRRSRKICTSLVALVAVSALAWPSVASAEEPIPSGHFEFRLGSYLPAVDEDLASPGPYELIFDNETMLLAEVEIGRLVYRDIGQAGVGGGFGFMQAVGKAVDANGAPSVDTTVFNIIPLRLLAFYQADLLLQELYIPLVPVVKLGINYYLWWVTDSSGSIASANGDSASGGTFGWHFAIGLHLLLDWFDETAANNLRYEFGIDNSYFFAEYMVAAVDDFGSSDSINLSDETLMFGLAFDY